MQQDDDSLQQTTRRNSFPKLRRLKPLNLTITRHCNSHKSYLSTPVPLPKPADSYTLSKVTETLYLGSERDIRRLTATDVSKIGVKKILSVQQSAIEPKNCDNPEILEHLNLLHVQATDVTSTNLIDQFDNCIDFIDSMDGATTIVHCQAGISRSATICMAYLMRKRGYNLDEAFEYLKKCRECIGPNFGFLGQLKLYEQRQVNTNGKTQ